LKNSESFLRKRNYLEREVVIRRKGSLKKEDLERPKRSKSLGGAEAGEESFAGGGGEGFGGGRGKRKERNRRKIK